MSSPTTTTTSTSTTSTHVDIDDVDHDEADDDVHLDDEHDVYAQHVGALTADLNARLRRHPAGGRRPWFGAAG